MKVLIYGGGAVGLGLASCLLKMKQSVDILAREQTVVSLRKNGLKRTGIFGDYEATPDQFYSCSSLDDIHGQSYDFILVCTKSFDTYNAALDIAEHKQLFNENSVIVHFQNGWGNAQQLIQAFDQMQIYTARVITGFVRPMPNEVNITVHAQPIHIGSLFQTDLQEIQELVQVIHAGGIPCETSTAVDRDLWAKMLYNCALNPLGAVLNVKYGLLGDYEYTRDIMNHIFAEIYQIFGVTDYATHWSTAKEYEDLFYDKLLPSTYDHESSMLQDIRQHKPTEIAALNGAVIDLADQNRIDVPYNRIVYNMLKFIEAK